jgi:hypothetical protein
MEKLPTKSNFMRALDLYRSAEKKRGASVSTNRHISLSKRVDFLYSYLLARAAKLAAH